MRAQAQRHLRRRHLPCLNAGSAHRLYDGLRELVCAGGAADIARAHLPVGVDLEHGLLYPFGGVALAEVAEHEDAGLEQRGRVGDTLTGDVWGGAVDGLEDRAQFADVRAGDETKPTDETRTQVRNDVAVEILKQHDVELLGAHDKLHAGVVHNLVVGLNLRVVGADLAEAVEKEAVGELHDVGLVGARHPLAPLAPRVLEGGARDAGRSLLRDYLQTLDDAGDDDVLKPRVEALGVLAHDDEVEFGVARPHVRQRAHGADVGIAVERLAQSNVDRREALADRRRDGAFERDLVALDGFEQVFGQRRAELFERLRARVFRLPLDVNARRLDDAYDRRRDLRPDAVARNECDSMCHGSVVRSQSYIA